MSDVVFVQMPFAGIERPALALGLFMSSLKGAGAPARSIYGNISFAEKVGLPVYTLIRSTTPSSLIGEWVFAESIFGDAATPVDVLGSPECHFGVEDEFIDFVVQYRGFADLPSLLADVRRQATEHVDEMAAQILRLGPKVVACTSMFDQHVASLALLTRIKALDPRVLTAIGGANCAGPMGRATHASFPAVDFTVTGEFDLDCVSFFTALIAADGDADRVDPLPDGVLGPVDRAGGREVTPPPAILRDMDRAAIPDYDDYFEQLYSSPLSHYVLPSLPLETSRGCWWGAKQHCTFCGLNAEGMTFRRKSAERALREIRLLTSRYAVYRISVADNIIDMSYFRTVLPELAADPREYSLFYETKANLKREQVKAMVEAGCNFIQPGIESLHDETLRIMKKGTTACTNIQVLKYCLELGTTPAWSILCGFPGSDPAWVAEIAADLPLLFHLPPPIGTTPIRFDRFSPYHQRPQDFGIELEPAPAYGLVYPFERAVLDDLAYFFREAGGIPAAVAEHAAIAWDVSARWREEFWGSNRALLVIEADDGHAIRIRDTRACAVTRSHHLEGTLARLLRALEQPATREGLLTRLQETSGASPLDPTEVEEGVAELAARCLVWRSGTQDVALPTPPAERQLSTRADSAVGRVDMARYLLDKFRFRRAVA